MNFKTILKTTSVAIAAAFYLNEADAQFSGIGIDTTASQAMERAFPELEGQKPEIHKEGDLSKKDEYLRETFDFKDQFGSPLKVVIEGKDPKHKGYVDPQNVIFASASNGKESTEFYREPNGNYRVNRFPNDKSLSNGGIAMKANELGHVASFEDAVDLSMKKFADEPSVLETIIKNFPQYTNRDAHYGIMANGQETIIVVGVLDDEQTVLEIDGMDIDGNGDVSENEMSKVKIGAGNKIDVLIGKNKDGSFTTTIVDFKNSRNNIFQKQDTTDFETVTKQAAMVATHFASRIN